MKAAKKKSKPAPRKKSKPTAKKKIKNHNLNINHPYEERSLISLNQICNVIEQQLIKSLPLDTQNLAKKAVLIPKFSQHFLTKKQKI